jgi:transposase
MEDGLVVIGVDAHKRTHTMVATDAVGRRLAEATVEATTDGHLRALEWAACWPWRRWAVEDCRHLTRTLEGDLLRAGEELVRVPTKMMSGARRAAREAGKSDPIDALAVARAAWREPDLPVARLAGPERELRLLVDHRDDLVRERTRIQSRIRWHLHEIDPTLHVRLRGLRSQKVVDGLIAQLQDREGMIVAIVREQLTRVRELNQRALELERQIMQLVIRLAPSLLAIPGCGALTAAKIVGETAGASRFGSQGRLRTLERHRTAARLDRQPGALPARSHRQPPGQLRAAPDRGHPSPRADARPRLLRAAHRAGQHAQGGTAAPPPSPLRRRLPHPAHRRGRPRVTLDLT